MKTFSCVGKRYDWLWWRLADVSLDHQILSAFRTPWHLNNSLSLHYFTLLKIRAKLLSCQRHDWLGFQISLNQCKFMQKLNVIEVLGLSWEGLACCAPQIFPFHLHAIHLIRSCQNASPKHPPPGIKDESASLVSETYQTRYRGVVPNGMHLHIAPSPRRSVSGFKVEPSDMRSCVVASTNTSTSRSSLSLFP